MHDPVPTDARWRRSTRSGGGENCVELAQGPTWAAVRDSKNATGPVLTADLAALLRAVQADRLR
ncbi:DUF397 domain-containing protein [Actinophytocola gossypii]|uniref:DUF397 domain-containing protein n=1 Tax=Actinophytocola gossypii TaxID=2812003 RepID=A0ABT2JGS5_9PSEU|nr:DUF397 domain-containing protein [Actinophytocola gossypii]MCT2587076.1 DUF397 domain-containing protein [Actinophytocola gossypii]